LRLIAGLEELTEGTITIGDRVVNDVEPKDRDLAMVFQSYALYPHLSVERNIEFPLRTRGVPKGERDRMVREAAAALGLTDLLGRKPAQLSGGQRQRVALARAIVRSPAAFLMDEPLSNLDAKLRVQTRAELVELHRRLEATVVYVTHDQVEAMTMGHRIAIMSDGVLQQVGPPQAVYAEPANVFVARFIGAPPMNTLPGPVVGERADVIVGIRPEHLQLEPAGSEGDRANGVDATVSVVESLGHERHVICRVGDDLVTVRRASSEPVPEPGAAVRLRYAPAEVHRFDAATGARR
jgi:ABC-type sugar transport system ATPase subunit